MLPKNDAHLDRVFRALAHPIRRTVLERLARGPETIVNLAHPHDVSLNAVSKHVKTLEDAGLVRRDRDRNYHRIGLRESGIKPAVTWLEYHANLWHDSLGALKRQMESE